MGVGGMRGLCIHREIVIEIIINIVSFYTHTHHYLVLQLQGSIGIVL